MQNAFVEDKKIQDNIGIVHELFHFLKLRKVKRKFKLGITLDIHKVYDKVKWDFLKAVMSKMRSCREWTNLIMNCISTVEFAVIVNGHLGNKLSSSRVSANETPYLLTFFS